MLQIVIILWCIDFHGKHTWFFIEFTVLFKYKFPQKKWDTFMQIPKKTITTEELFQSGNVIYTHVLSYEFNPIHKHNFIEFFYVISGKSMHLLNDKEEIIGINDA